MADRSPAPAVIAFDLDGTLVDTAPDLLDTLDVVLDEAGAARLPREDTRKMIGAGARALVQRGLDAAGIRLDKPAADKLYERFLEHYAAHIADRSAPFPGLIPALDALTAQRPCAGGVHQQAGISLAPAARPARPHRALRGDRRRRHLRRSTSRTRGHLIAAPSSAPAAMWSAPSWWATASPTC